VDDILAAIPAYSTGNRVLSLCFVDPFDIGIKFETLNSLSDRFVDFLVLLAIYMDANRNYENYIKDEAIKLDEFLGSRTWREEWKQKQIRRGSFPSVSCRGIFEKHGEAQISATAVLQDEASQDR